MPSEAVLATYIPRGLDRHDGGFIAMMPGKMIIVKMLPRPEIRMV